jgi:catechol 2,3-dioxygenase-like lactoylglutathione lyase family enzyme
MGIIGTDHTSYTVSDLTRTLAFYRDLLGFEVVWERPEIVHNYWRAVVGFPDAIARDAMLRVPGSDYQIELIEYKHPRGVAQNLTPNNPGSSHVSYLVDDLQSFFTRLKEANVAFISEPVYLDTGPYVGGWSLYMKDPDGIVIELFQEAPGK